MSIRGIIRMLWKTQFGGDEHMLKPGEKAPDFDVSDHHGNRVQLSALRGRKVVLWFYPKADTPG